MKNDKPCYGCGRRHMGCHAQCPDYMKNKAEREAAKAAKRKEEPAGIVLADGYIRRQRKARRQSYKDTRRWRGC